MPPRSTAPRRPCERIDRALLALGSRESELREQLARERAARQPERLASALLAGTSAVATSGAGL